MADWCQGSGKYTSNAFLFTIMVPLPSFRYTRATAAFLLPEVFIIGLSFQYSLLWVVVPHGDVQFPRTQTNW